MRNKVKIRKNKHVIKGKLVYKLVVLILAHLLGLDCKIGSHRFNMKHEGKNLSYATLRVDKIKIT